MRYIGSKLALLSNIKDVIDENVTGGERIFCDLFSGTASVARYFKPHYKIISNDFLHFSYVIQRATIENNAIPSFDKLQAIGIQDPFRFLEETPCNHVTEDYFIYHNYSPSQGCDRMYISPKNAARIDFIRQTIESWRDKDLVTEDEYYYLLAALIEGVPYVSNITGTYGAYLKKWDNRSYKDLEMIRLEVEDNGYKNKCYNRDAGQLISEIAGDILYIDPPYNSRQYAPNYHLLETISKYDYPKIKGVTGVRDYANQKSAFSIKKDVAQAFEKIIEKAEFKNIILSYSNEGLMSFDTIETILKKHGIAKTYKKYTIPYRKYKGKISKEEKVLYEYIFYIKKDIGYRGALHVAETPFVYHAKSTKPHNERHKKYIKSPLNYIGGKYKLLPQIIPLFPKDINTFVDLFSGGANVAINVEANKIICNDINTKIIEMFNAFKATETDEILNRINNNIEQYNLSKTNEKGFLAFRDAYNKNPNPIDLYTLVSYSFNYQFRFNNNHMYNNPFGKNRSRFSDKMQSNLIAFADKLKSKDIVFSDCDFTEMDFTDLGPQDFVYCDPPYLITTGSYNDGKRGFKDWGMDEELQLYALLDKLDERHIKFALSNVLTHKEDINHSLLNWSKKYNIIHLNNSYSNSSYNTKRGESDEVLIINY